MKRFIALCFASILVISAFGQIDRSTKLIIQNKSVVEIMPDEPNEPSDILNIRIKVDGQLVKSFAPTDFMLPQVIGTFHGLTWNRGEYSDAEYVLYRTSMGHGACVGGTLYVLAFLEDDATGEYTNVHVSPPLTTCLGEYPNFAIARIKGDDILDIAGHTLNLDKFDKWVKKKTVFNRRRKK